MAVFEIDVLEEHERDQIQQYSEFMSCNYIGGYLVTVRSIHHAPHCPHRPTSQPGGANTTEEPLRCSVMPNGVHVHLYLNDKNERYMRFIEVSDEENEALFDEYYG